LGLALAALACACGGIHAGDDPDPEPKPKVYKVPLKSVCVSFDQEGAKVFKRGSKEDPDGELDAIWELDLREQRQLFLVRAGKVASQIAFGGADRSEQTRGWEDIHWCRWLAASPEAEPGMTVR
jgi:hypothetical protein